MSKIVIGSWVYPDEAEWSPIQKIFDDKTMPPIMYMGVVIGEEKRVHLYKHKETRRYLNLDDEGRCYQHCGSVDDLSKQSMAKYEEIEQCKAIEDFNS